MNRRRTIVKVCAEADRDHAANPRAFAHVDHYPNCVCVASALVTMPRGFVLGILLHEVGHLACLPAEHTEQQADRMAENISGVRIERRSHGAAKNLEFIRPKDEKHALRVLRHLLTNIGQ